jgi:hypothetical protein
MLFTVNYGLAVQAAAAHLPQSCTTLPTRS